MAVLEFLIVVLFLFCFMAVLLKMASKDKEPEEKSADKTNPTL